MFDLNVFCIGQKEPTTQIPNIDDIFIENINEKWNQEQKCYHSIATIFNFINGFWYSLSKDPEEIAGTAICDYVVGENIYPYWVEDSEVIKDLNTLIIKHEYLQSFIAILMHLIDASPIRKIMVFCRYQSSDTEVLCGTINVNEFFKLLSKGEILTNICYFIEG